MPDDVRRKLQAVVDDLQSMRESLRVNGPDQVHLTLHFLGQVPLSQMATVENQLSRAIAASKRFELAAEGVGAFPGFGRPQVLWAGIAGNGVTELTGLQAIMGSALKATGITIEDRPFHPHLTLARVRRPIRGPQRKILRDWQDRWKQARFGTIPVEKLILFRSQLGAGPARHSIVASFELQ